MQFPMAGPSRDLVKRVKLKTSFHQQGATNNDIDRAGRLGHIVNDLFAVVRDLGQSLVEVL